MPLRLPGTHPLTQFPKNTMHLRSIMPHRRVPRAIAPVKPGKTHDGTSGTSGTGKQQHVTDFCARVAFLIDKHYKGNVSQAARDLRVSQRGLAKVYAGETTEPRLTLIQQLLKRFRAYDPLWIILGEESTASKQLDAAAREHARVLLRRQLAELDDLAKVESPSARGAGGSPPHSVTRKAASR